MRSLLTFLHSLLLSLLRWLWRVTHPNIRSTNRRSHGSEKEIPEGLCHRRTTPKPTWFLREVLRLKALMPGNGCRKTAATFNYLHRSKQESVDKSYVARTIRNHGEEILRLRQELKNRRPRRLPRNLIWALDLTFVPTDSKQQTVLGLIDHGSRACLALRELQTRRTIDILRVLLDVIEVCGKPKRIRTDNEPIFTSRLFRFSLLLLGIRHQRTAPFAPWQNGRIERLIGTFKARLAPWRSTTETGSLSQADLNIFRAWYNGVRPHQHLDGIVPAEAWAGRSLRSSRPRIFNAWNGALSGYY
ncbi:MAG: integrase core domain-containing protein [Thermoanaerobaculia bacterium]|nr:integrase core domain-containing protein [Thermoanaerobaculia bacterium]